MPEPTQPPAPQADEIETCKMVHQEPLDFAQCETHDETFPLGEKCKFDGRVMWEVYAEEADQQRARAVLAEEEAERLRAIKRVPPRDHRCPTCSHCMVMQNQRERGDKAHDRIRLLEDAIRRAVWLAADARARVQEGNRAFVFVDELVAAMRPDTTGVETQPQDEETIAIPRDLLDSLLDSDQCRFDHNGDCQAHMFFGLEGRKCPIQRGKDLLGENGKAGS